jgi:restriction system protein
VEAKGGRMPVPDFQTIMLPLLKLSGDGQEHQFAQAVESLQREFQLTPEEVAELLPSKRYPRFRQRVGWAKTYLNRARLLDYTQGSNFRISDRGRGVLSEQPQKIDIKFLMRFPEFKEFRDAANSTKVQTAPQGADADERTPRELLESSFVEIRQALAQELLEKAKTNSPAFFQQLVIDLLVRIYGGNFLDAGQVVGGSGDRGIDGIIRQDVLGLDAVYVQAKRYSEVAVGSEIVRNFAGSLLQHKAAKGVLITTSRFSDEARRAAESMDKRIVLIDGPGLAELLIDQGVGVIDDQAYVVKRMDTDYFNEA